MGAETGCTDVPDAQYADAGLHRNHAYSVQAVHHLSEVDRFVMLRDPHAKTKYKDNQIPAVTLGTLQKIYQDEISAGSFWISWLTFRRFFTTLTICSYRDDLFDARLEGKFTPHAAYFVQAYYFRLDR